MLVLLVLLVLLVSKSRLLPAVVVSFIIPWGW
jgi:hypothetical protein